MKSFLKGHIKTIVIIIVGLVGLLTIFTMWRYYSIDTLPETGGAVFDDVLRDDYYFNNTTFTKPFYCDGNFAGEFIEGCKQTVYNNFFTEPEYIRSDKKLLCYYHDSCIVKDYVCTVKSGYESYGDYMYLYCPPEDKNTFEYKYDDEGPYSHEYYCNSEVPMCSTQGYLQQCAFGSTSGLDWPGCVETGIKSKCVRANVCDIDNGVCTTTEEGEMTYQYCEEVVDPTNIPTLEPTLIPTNTPVITHTPTNTPITTITLTPTPDYTNAINCGALDVYNTNGQAVGDKYIDLNDFIKFRQVYSKVCNDDAEDYGVCGGKNRRYDGDDHVVDLNDFIYFAKVYNRENCSRYGGFVSLPETGEQVTEINYVLIILIEIIVSLSILLGTYNYKKYSTEPKSNSD